MKKIVKKILGILPSDFPNKIYNTLFKYPPLKSLANFFIKKFIPVSIKINEGEIFLNKNDVAVSGALALGSFENAEINIFRQSIKFGMNIVDIGANIGYYTVVASKITGPEGKVFAYEPEKTNLSFLKNNIEKNKLLNVKIEEIAISDRTSKQFLFLTEDNKGTHSLVDNRQTKNKVLVQTDTLDNSLKQWGSPKIDIIKMDIEGAEVLALEGMLDTIARNPRIILFTEFYPKAIKRFGRSPINFLERLQALRFSLFLINEDTKKLQPLIDLEVFVKNFSDYESVKNIYAIKMAN